MEPIIRPATDADSDAIIGILNYYIENSLAAYPLQAIPVQAWDRFKAMSRPNCLWAMELDGTVIGFGLLKWFMNPGTFDHTADVGYFILPGYVGQGLGKKMLERIENEARQIGIKTLVANVSSLNETSLNFQQKMGYTQCGCLPSVGKKQDRFFDVIWFYKNI